MKTPKPGIYQHYKGKIYHVIGTATHSETSEALVVYRGRYDDPELGRRPLFVRPLPMFLEDVEIDGTIVPRFTYIKE
jgi:hypothetical protein